ncbi:MAG: inositol monophosphatase family protein [Candidatus Aureabacteria bacterium]|nr:inositol monophosphatase family protein [Candidatus Auribacterota bacterium]
MSQSFIETAIRAARAAGSVIRADFGKPRGVRFKAKTNPVTDTDLNAEKAILSILRAEAPSHDLLTEESIQAPRRSEYLWIIDPLDGTVNFTHSYPFLCVSIALTYRDDPVLGVVLDPLRDEIFLSGKGGGATLNGEPIHVSRASTLDESLLCTGFPYTIKEKPADTFQIFERLSLRAQGVRRDGTAALDICYVAAGRLDGFWERNLCPWDTAAGMLILAESGGRMTDFSGNPFNPFLKEIVASNGQIHDQMVSLITPAERPA